MSLEGRDYGAVPRRPPVYGLKRYYQTVREHWWLVLACLVVTVGAATAYALLAPKKYSAQAEILVSPIPTTDTTLIGLPVLHSSSDPTRDVLTAASVMTIVPVAQATISALHLHESPNDLLAGISATPIGQSNLVAIQANASSAAEAQTIANTFARQVISTRTAALHAAVTSIIPGLRSRVAALPIGQRSGPGTIGDQLNQLEQIQNTPDPTITISSLAQLPAGPYSPKRSLALIAGILAGLILGIGAAFVFHSLDPRLRREEQLRELFRLPILARIPRAPSHQAQPILPHEMPLWAQEGYRTLRTVLSSRAMGERTVVLVTSSSPSEGKTTTAISLALALAQGGSRVVLVEADMRRPTIALSLGIRPTYGTEDVLMGRARVQEALVSVRFGSTPLQVLAVRRPSVALVDQLSLGVAERLVTEAAKLSDFVVIDSPPLTTVIDALPLAQLADEVLIVARVGVSKLGLLAELHELLVENENHPSGLVLIGEAAPGAGEYYYAPADGDTPSTRRDPAELAPVASSQD